MANQAREMPSNRYRDNNFMPRVDHNVSSRELDDSDPTDQHLDRPIEISSKSCDSGILQYFTMPMDCASVVTAIMLLFGSYLLICLMLRLVNMLALPLSIILFVMVFLPHIQDGSLQTMLPELLNKFPNLNNFCSSTCAAFQ